MKQLVSCLPTNVLHNVRFFSCIFIFFSFNRYFDVVVCTVRESCSHVRKTCLTKNFLFAEKALVYFAKTQCPGAAKTLILRLYVLEHVLWLVKYISYVVFDWLMKRIFSNVKMSYFLRVFKYDFSQWPKTLHNTATDVYEIIFFNLCHVSDKDPSLWIEIFAIPNFRCTYTKLNLYCSLPCKPAKNFYVVSFFNCDVLRSIAFQFSSVENQLLQTW